MDKTFFTKITLLTLRKFIEKGKLEAKNDGKSFDEYCRSEGVDIRQEIREISDKIGLIKTDDNIEIFEMLEDIIEQIENEKL
jgi:hypothetical protein